MDIWSVFFFEPFSHIPFLYLPSVVQKTDIVEKDTLRGSIENGNISTTAANDFVNN
ncbi:MAG: hypothetical protein QNJ68_09820 [Microcoleaceae cyanobacterium MO_207.B10]|nr:hypothetical protein [Microcoleaceae cyanobacterium MO_207.B10]